MRKKRTHEQMLFDATRSEWWKFDGPTLRVIAQELEPIAARLSADDHRHKLLVQIRKQGETLSRGE